MKRAISSGYQSGNHGGTNSFSDGKKAKKKEVMIKKEKYVSMYINKL